MRLMPQAVDAPAPSPLGIVVDFDSSIQSQGALDAAAYRLIGTATCRIDRVGARYVCRLAPTANPQKGAALNADDLKERFLNFVTDENLRTCVAERTEGIRNVILALAFGSLVGTQKDVG